MEKNKTFLTQDEELLLLSLLNCYMSGAYKDMIGEDSTLYVRNDFCLLCLTPAQVETLCGLLSKFEVFEDYHQKVIDWIIEE